MLYKYKLVLFYWWLNDFIKKVLQHKTCIFTWGGARVSGKSFSLKGSILFSLDCLTPSVCTCNVNSAYPWAWWFATKIKCILFRRADCNTAGIKWSVTGSLQTFTPIPLQKVVGQMPHLPHHVRRPVYGVVGIALKEDNVWKHTTSEKHRKPIVVKREQSLTFMST